MTGLTGEELARRFVDDRDSLSDREAQALYEWLRENPARADELRGDLVLDDLLGQGLAVDRRNFPAQVRQRVSDWLRGERALDEKAAELRRIAQGQLGEYARPKSQAAKWTWVVALAAVVALLAASPWLWSLADPALARVESIEGQAFARSGSQRRALRQGDVVRATDEVVVPAGSRVGIVYEDGTDVTFEGGSTARFARYGARGAKRIRLDAGELAADVATQPAGDPMTFVTPHSETTVLGTEIVLEVLDDETRLEVREGRVEFRRTLPPRGEKSQSAVVETDQSGVSAKSGLSVEEGIWPTRRLGLAFLFVATGPSATIHDPATGESRKTALIPQGRAWRDPFARLAFDGGRFAVADEDSRRLREALSRTGGFSFETTVLLREPATKPVSLVEFGDVEGGQSPAFSLRLDGTKLSLAATLTEKPREGEAAVGEASPIQRDLGELPINEATHWIVTLAQGRLHVYRDGTLVQQEEGLPQAPVVPENAHLTFGPSPMSAASFDGALEAVAIYDRELAPREARRNSLELRRSRSLRPEESFAKLRVEPISQDTLDRWRTESLAKLEQTTLLVVPMRRTDAPSPDRSTIVMATLFDPARPGDAERLAATLSRSELAGIPLSQLPGLDEAPRIELQGDVLGEAAGAPEFFLDGTGD